MASVVKVADMTVVVEMEGEGDAEEEDEVSEGSCGDVRGGCGLCEDENTGM